jgi:hypothetical protein
MSTIDDDALRDLAGAREGESLADAISRLVRDRAVISWELEYERKALTAACAALHTCGETLRGGSFLTSELLAVIDRALATPIRPMPK